MWDGQSKTPGLKVPGGGVAERLSGPCYQCRFFSLGVKVLSVEM